MKTSGDIKLFFYNLLKESTLKNEVNGGLYYYGIRPRDSRLEDIIIGYTTSTAEQVQEGVVTINVHVPDIDTFANGQFVENVQRCNELQQIAQAWVDSITSRTDYRITLSEPIDTVYDENKQEHVVSIRIYFKVFN